MWVTIICCIISSVISVLLSDKIIQGINIVFIKLGLSKNGDISGVWKATFEMGKGSKKMNPEYAELEKDFFDFATSKGMVGIKGHRSVGGFRASLYNALPKESVEALVACMKEFEAKH